MDFFVFKRSKFGQAINIVSLAVWAAGFIIYRLLMSADIVIGNTLPDILITALIYIVVNEIKEKYE